MALQHALATDMVAQRSTAVGKPWYRRAVLYQIYPLSFADANADGYGDLRGIINHLDYLNDGTADSLGVGAIWLSPVYASPMTDWGYDISDHCAIDRTFGTMADFDRLVSEAHLRGIKVVMDYVANHTSIEHAWFEESRSTLTNAKRDWYIWSDPKPDGSPPNNWLSRFGGSAWKFEEQTGQYYLHSFLETQPDLNWRNPDVRTAMLDVLRFWLKRGVDGFRADAVLSLVKDSHLRDNPPNPAFVKGVSDPADKFLETYSAMKEPLGNVLGGFCNVIASHDDTYLVSEAYLDVAGLHELYGACREHPIHAPLNFNLMSIHWGAANFRDFIDEYEASLGPDDWPNYVLGNHDRPRLASRLGQERARLLAVVQLTLRGMPVIYNGDELGLENGSVLSSQAKDQWGRYPGTERFSRDGARTPFPWNEENGAGFTTVQPWLPLSPDSTLHNVENELKNPASMHELYRHFMHLRQHIPALTDGTYRSIDTDNPNVFAYVRETSFTRCYMLANFSDRTQDVSMGAIGMAIGGTHTAHGSGESHTGGVVSLEPYEGRLYEVRQDLRS